MLDFMIEVGKCFGVSIVAEFKMLDGYVPDNKYDDSQISLAGQK